MWTNRFEYDIIKNIMVNKKGELKCPKCGSEERQMKNGKHRSGTQNCLCGKCKKSYTLNPKSRAYPKETQEMALKLYHSGVSGREIGKMLNMSKANVYNWIKKNQNN